jgi:hypothetical protein
MALQLNLTPAVDAMATTASAHFAAIPQSQVPSVLHILQRKSEESNSLKQIGCSFVCTRTITATTTTSVPYGGLFPSLRRRDEAYPTITATPYGGSSELVRKADSPSAYFTICTEGPTAISSACSCLLGTVAAGGAVSIALEQLPVSQRI